MKFENTVLPQEDCNELSPGDPRGTRHTSSTHPTKPRNQNLSAVKFQLHFYNL